MKVDIVAIGNSRGIRIPKALLEQCGFGERAELAVEDRRLIVSSVVERRKGWDAAFRKMAVRNDDQLLETPPSAFDEEEWTW